MPKEIPAGGDGFLGGGGGVYVAKDNVLTGGVTGKCSLSLLLKAFDEGGGLASVTVALLVEVDVTDAEGRGWGWGEEEEGVNASMMQWFVCVVEKRE